VGKIIRGDIMQKNIINIAGHINGIQIQQNNKNGNQVQTIMRDFDYEKIKNIVTDIIEHENELQNVYKENNQEVIVLLKSIIRKIDDREDSTIIRRTISELKNVPMAVSTNIISTSIMQLLSVLNS